MRKAMNKKYILLFLACMIVSAQSCKKAPSLSFSPETVEIGSEGGAVQISVKANYAWSAKSSDSWISVSSAADANTLALNILPNTLPDDREGSVQIDCEGLAKSMTVRQSQKNMVVFKGTGPVTVSWEKQEFEIAAESNVGFSTEIQCEGSWLSLVRVKSLTSRTLVLSAEENEGVSTREALIIFSFNGESIRTVNVSQQGHPQLFTVVHTLSDFNAPVIFGFGMSEGRIWWGDGSNAVYSSNLKHSYTLAGEHELRVEISGATSVSLTDIVGVEKVDLSQF